MGPNRRRPPWYVWKHDRVIGRGGRVGPRRWRARGVVTGASGLRGAFGLVSLFASRPFVPSFPLPISASIRPAPSRTAPPHAIALDGRTPGVGGWGKWHRWPAALEWRHSAEEGRQGSHFAPPRPGKKPTATCFLREPFESKTADEKCESPVEVSIVNYCVFLAAGEAGKLGERAGQFIRDSHLHRPVKSWLRELGDR